MHSPHGEKKEHGVRSKASWVLVLCWDGWGGVLFDVILCLIFPLEITFPRFHSELSSADSMTLGFVISLIIKIKWVMLTGLYLLRKNVGVGHFNDS